MEQTYAAWDCPTFSERMDDAKDAALLRRESTSRLRGRVSWRVPTMRQLVTVAQAALELGVSEARVKILCGQGRIAGAKRSKRRSRPWDIPTQRQPDGTYRIIVVAGKRGPKMRNALSPAGDGSEVPF